MRTTPISPLAEIPGLITTPRDLAAHLADPRHAEGPKALIADLYGDSGIERVSASLGEAKKLLLGRPERTKLGLYVHDGQPSHERPDAVATTVAALRRKGIVVLGIYVGPLEKIAKLQAIFGIDQTIPVEWLNDLPARLGGLLLKYKAR